LRRLSENHNSRQFCTVAYHILLEIAVSAGVKYRADLGAWAAWQPL